MSIERVRITAAGPTSKDTTIEVRASLDSPWVDISKCVARAEVTMDAGDLNRVQLTLLPATVTVREGFLSTETLAEFAAIVDAAREDGRIA